MKNQYTPGPWYSYFPAQGEPRIGSKGSRTPDIDVAIVKEPDDAHLIAAAPELLEALEYLLSRCDRIVHHSGDEDPRLKAERTIAKATGGAE